MSNRPDRTNYYLGLAIAISAKAECQGQHVGAVLVGAGNRVLSTGYNGAPEGWGNCSDGGVCPRCDRREHFGPGDAYDKCICVHAEMNAISAAARFSVALDGATAYVTHQPCFTCAKEMIQAGIDGVYYAIALPVVPKGPDKLGLRETETRLLGQLRAVHVTSLTGAMEGLNRARQQFKKELDDAAAGSAPKRATSAITSRSTSHANGRANGRYKGGKKVSTGTPRAKRR
jgi:dCMP deaminase